MIQAGKQLLFIVLLLPGLWLLTSADAAFAATALETKSDSASRPKADDTVSVGDLVHGTEDFFSDLSLPSLSLPTFGWGDKAPDKTEAEKTTIEKTATGGKDTALKDIPARSGVKPTELPAATGTAETPPPPYRVYPSPYVPDATPLARSQSRSAVREYSQETAPATISALAEGAKKSGLPPPLTGPASAPVTGMSRVYFPLFPLGAPSDAPPQLLPLSSNHDLGEDQAYAQSAIIAVHDLTRNASEVLTMLTTLAGADNDTTLIIAPQFPIEIDIARFASYLPDQGQTLARWDVDRVRGWQTGEESAIRLKEKGVSSFTAMDMLLLYLSDRSLFPQLQSVVVAGHGMGADFVQRYAALGQAPDILVQQDLSVRFVAANPSSYLYFTGVRPSGGAPSFTMPDTAQCPGMNNYPYGLNNLTAYARRTGANAIRLRYPERQVMFLLSERILTDPYLDIDCAAQAQGKDRLARGRNYERYMNVSFGDLAQKSQTFVLVPTAGYDAVALFGSYCGLSALFGDGTCDMEGGAQARIIKPPPLPR